jgi:hypothetical protein
VFNTPASHDNRGVCSGPKRYDFDETLFDWVGMLFSIIAVAALHAVFA